MRAPIQREIEKKSLIDAQSIYEGRIIKLKTETYQFANGKKTVEIIEHPGAVVLIPIDPQGRILLIEQWRRATGKILMELPAGTLENNEHPIECASRELQEETGFFAKKITPLGGFYSAPGFCSEYLHLFLAEELEHAPLPPDDDEMIDLVPLTVDEAQDRIEKNQIQDAKTVAGILRYLFFKGINRG